MSDLHILLDIPPSTSERLIFPLTPNTQQFDPSFYEYGFKIGIGEINQVLTDIQTAHKPITAKIFKAQFLYITFIVWSLSTMLGMYLLVHLGSVAVLFSFIFYMLLLLLGSSIFRSKVSKLTTEKKAVAQKVIEKYNKSFASQGLRWFLPSHFPMWIELHKDYHSCRENEDHKPIYIPPVMDQQALDQSQNHYEESQYQNQGNNSPIL